jgi:hypothetical protein
MQVIMAKQMDPDHDAKRETLRIVGPAVLIAGLIFAAIGIGNFFASFGSFEPPRYFWCAFVGLPLIGLGASICKFAYFGAISRFMANEVAPVSTDVVNYMASGTKGSVRDLASAVGEGLRAGVLDDQEQTVVCQSCHEENDVTANFCGQCGKPLPKPHACSSCGKFNDADARFCDNCGKSIA